MLKKLQHSPQIIKKEKLQNKNLIGNIKINRMPEIGKINTKKKHETKLKK